MAPSLPMGITIVNTNKILISSGYLKVKESMYTKVSIWVNTILNHISTRAILSTYEISYIIYRPA